MLMKSTPGRPGSDFNDVVVEVLEVDDVVVSYRIGISGSTSSSQKWSSCIEWILFKNGKNCDEEKDDETDADEDDGVDRDEVGSVDELLRLNCLIEPSDRTVGLNSLIEEHFT